MYMQVVFILYHFGSYISLTIFRVSWQQWNLINAHLNKSVWITFTVQVWWGYQLSYCVLRNSLFTVCSAFDCICICKNIFVYLYQCSFQATTYSKTILKAWNVQHVNPKQGVLTEVRKSYWVHYIIKTEPHILLQNLKESSSHEIKSCATVSG